MRKKTICAMMTGFLAVQGIEVHAETQQTTGEAASAVESVELEAEIIENSDVTDADGKAGPEELLPDEKSEEEPPIEEKPEQEPEPPEEKTDPAETGKKETEGEEKMLPPTVIPDPEKEPAERWEEKRKKFRKIQNRGSQKNYRRQEIWVPGNRNQRKDVKKQIQKNQRQKSQIRRERILEKWTQKNQIMKIQVQKNPERKI